jgi:penicillin amidase
VRIVDTARLAHSTLRPETADFVAAYVEGVNAGLHGDAPELRQLGVVPARWEPWTPLAVFLAQHLLFATLPGKLWDARARDVLGDDARLLSREGPSSSGSNAWAVGGQRTANGLPMIGGDPHRVIESPGVYQQIRLSCPEFDVVGFAFPGVPGTPHFAHAGAVAWAITNAMADYQDVFSEQLRRHDGQVEALGPAGWEPTHVRVETIAVAGSTDEQVEVVETARGPVFAGSVESGRGWSLRTASGVLGEVGFDALLPLLRARSAADVEAAFDDWVEPVNNVVIADRSGDVRYRVAGRVPVRAAANRLGIVDAADPDAAWTGWLDPLPRHHVPPDGQVVTANERRGPESDAIGTTFAPPHRATRIHELLEGRRELTVADFAAIHGDALALPARRYQDLIRDLEPRGEAAGVRDEILAWDGRMTADSRGAAAFAAWRTALTRRLAAEPVFVPLTRPIIDDPIFAPALDLTSHIGLALEGLVAADSPYGIDVHAHALAALSDAAGHPSTWGETHVVEPVHAFDLIRSDLGSPSVPPLALSGDLDCVRCTASIPGVIDVCARGSVARYVWDLADREAGGWVVPMGAAGAAGDAHHLDQQQLWAAAELAPILTDWGRLTE